MKKQIVILVYGGVVQAVYSNDPVIDVNILDMDTQDEQERDEQETALDKAKKDLTQIY